MGKASKCLGQLEAKIVVDGVVDVLNFKALYSVKHEMILGMNFIKREYMKLKIGIPFGVLERLFCRMESGIRSAVGVKTV